METYRYEIIEMGGQGTMKFAVIVFPGSNCDVDLMYAIKDVMGEEAEYVWHDETSLAGFDGVLLPGVFLLRGLPSLRSHRTFLEYYGRSHSFCRRRKTGLWYVQWLPDLDRSWLAARGFTQK